MVKCPHCGKEIEPKHMRITWLRIKGKAQSVERIEYLGRPGTHWFEKLAGPKIVYVVENQ